MTEVSQERKKHLMGRLAQKVVDMKLAPVAIVMLESSKPLSFLASQTMVFFNPFYHAFFKYAEYDEITSLLEERENIEDLIVEIERLENERSKK